MVQPSYPYMITGKTITLTIQIFVSKVMPLLFKTLSRFVIGFLLRSKVSFNFKAAVTVHSDFRAQENKMSVSTFPPSICCEIDGSRCHDLSFLNVEF